MKVGSIVELLNRNFPEKLQYSWDNSSLNIGNEEKEVKKIILTLEVTKEVIDEAVEKNADMIISHHPFLFSKINRINKSDLKGSLIYKLIQNDISVYCMHTSYDIAFDGLNDYFMDVCGIENLGVLDKLGLDEDYNEKHYGLGRIGRVNPIKVDKFLEKLKTSLKIESIRYIGDMDKIIEKVAVVTGSGAEYFETTSNMDIDILITGDVKYHQAMDCRAMGMSMADCGHFGTERIFVDSMFEFLNKSLNGIKVIKTNNSIDPFIEI